MATLCIFSGVCAATSSISMPPSELAIKRHALRGAVDDHADVEFLADVGALLHQQAPHEPAFGPGLMGHQRHAEDLRGELVDLLERLRHLDAAALAAAAGVNLRLDDPDLAAELARRRIRLGDRKAGHAARRRHAVLAQDLLALILVNVHVSVLVRA